MENTLDLVHLVEEYCEGNKEVLFRAYSIYFQAKTEFNAKYGSGLNVPDYYEHRIKREDYASDQARGYIVLGLYENNNRQSTEKD